MRDVVNVKAPRVLPCGCCTGGCVCFDHADSALAIDEAVCDWHLVSDMTPATLTRGE